MSTPLQVNFGAGGNRLEGWENWDAEVDIRHTLPYRSETVDRVFSEHCPEHITGPEFLRFLDECKRILKPGGSIRLCMPVIHTKLKREHARDLILGHGHLAAYTPDLIEAFLWAAGFRSITQTDRMDIDGHHNVIGKELDDIETYRVEAVKP